jgi:hypothetical protein
MALNLPYSISREQLTAALRQVRVVVDDVVSNLFEIGDEVQSGRVTLSGTRGGQAPQAPAVEHKTPTQLLGGDVPELLYREDVIAALNAVHLTVNGRPSTVYSYLATGALADAWVSAPSHFEDDDEALSGDVNVKFKINIEQVDIHLS